MRPTLPALIALALLATLPSYAEGLAVGPWDARAGVYHAAAPGHSLYCLTDQPYVIGEGSAEATVTIRRRLAPAGWADAAVMISSDSGNLWVLGLVEGPGGERYTELMERCQDVHQAQSTGVTRLTAADGGFAGTWEYGKSYRLRLSLTRDGVSGRITDAATGQAIAQHGYVFGGALAVRDGWATLRVEQLEAEFSDLKVAAATPIPAAGARQYPQARLGCVGIYLGEDLPGAEPTPKFDELTRVLTQAGLAAVPLTSRDLADEGALTFPGLRYLAADLRRVPAGALLPLKRWMQQGGTLVSLTAPAFGSFFWPGSAGWITWEQFTQAKLQEFGRDARPIVTWAADELPNWQQTLGGDATKRATLALDGEAPDHRPAASVVVPHFGNGWWSIDRDFAAPPARPGEQLLCFWAKGDGKTPELSLEIREKDQSRWVGVFPLTQEWRYCVLAPQSFAYWRDNASKGRGGPGDEVRVENAVALRWGISGTHTASVLSSDATEHHFTLGSVALASAPPAALAGLGPAARPDIEGVSPGYKLFELTGATAWEPTALGKQWGMSGQWPAMPAYAAIERPAGEGFGRGHLWRWIPLVKAVDASGKDLGSPVTLVLNETLSLPRCAWLSVGTLHSADLARPELQAAIGKAVARLASGPLLFEGGTDRFLAYPDEPLTVGARATSYGSASADAQVVIRVARADGKLAAPETRLPVVTGPRGMASAKAALAPLSIGEYTVVTNLIAGGQITDTITHPLTVRARSQEPPAAEIVRRDGGRFTLAGKPWHPVGVNYWVHNLGGTPTDVYTNGWLDPVSYQPSVVEADLAQLERLGCHAIAAVGAEIHWGQGGDTPQLRDLREFLDRCQRHHIKVILFVGGLDPRGRDDAGARTIIRAVRNHPALMGYDIAWEPGYGDARRAYTPQWRDWLVQQYGSLAQAEAAFGYALPRDVDGKVDAPSDELLATDGAWRAITGAYRAFIDYQLGIEYRHSAAVVRSEDPWHLAGFRGSTPDSPQGFKPVEQPSVLHFMDWAGPEGYDVPSYGKLSPWDWIEGRGLCTRMLSFLSGGKPVVWMEFGMPIYPNGTDWTDDLIHLTPAKYKYQADEGRQFWQMQVESGAWGSFAWWYPGGFRLGENSECGFVDPNNAIRPVAKMAQQLWPKFAASETRKPDTWLEFQPESHPGGWVGEYLRLRGEYQRLAAEGKTVDVRTAGQAMTSATCPLIGPAGEPWPGAGPLRYLNAVFERVRVRAVGGNWQEIAMPTAPGVPIEARLPAGQAVELEAWVGNLAEAKWLRNDVSLSLTGGAVSQAALAADTAFQASGRFAPVRLTGSLTAPLKLRLQTNAQGRATFGEILNLTLVPR